MRVGLLTLSAALLLPAALGAQTPAPPANADAPADRLNRELLQRADGKVPPDDIRIDANWRRGTEIVSSRVYGTGVGIWREKTQFPLSRDQVLALLQEIRRARFGAMPAFFGSEEAEGEEESGKQHQKEKEKEKERRNEKVYLRGSLTVRVGTEVKRVAQYMEGDQNAEFAALVEDTLAASEKAAAKGVGASSLSEGLAAVADGKLAPETLQVFVQRRAGRPGASDPAEGWTLRIDGRRVFDRSGRPTGTDRVLVLSDLDFRRLVALLRENDVAALPRNLYSPEYVRLEVRLLDRNADLTARRYTGKTASSLGAKQEAFDRAYAALLALHERAQKEGAEAPAGAE